MTPVALGLLLGVLAGAISVLLMLPLAFPDKRRALAAAFTNRFAIGFLISVSALPVHPVIAGVLIGLLLSIPDALITKAHIPILATGALLGGLCGLAVLFFS